MADAWTGNEPDWACVIKHTGITETWTIFEGDYQATPESRLGKLKPVLDLIPPNHKNETGTRWHFTKSEYLAILRGGE